MNTMATTKLKHLREELLPKISQEDMAIKAAIRVGTYKNIEHGRNVSYTSAKKILKALNELRATQGLPEVGLEDMGLSIV